MSGTSLAPTVLIVDDDEDQLLTFKILLESRHSNVITARNAADAMALLQNRTVDLMLCDVNMPKISGKQFIKEVRVAREGLPIISFSADPEYLEEEYQTWGANAFCDKSRSRELLRTVQRYLKP